MENAKPPPKASWQRGLYGHGSTLWKFTLGFSCSYKEAFLNKDKATVWNKLLASFPVLAEGASCSYLWGSYVYLSLESHQASSHLWSILTQLQKASSCCIPEKKNSPLPCVPTCCTHSAQSAEQVRKAPWTCNSWEPKKFLSNVVVPRTVELTV